MAQSIDSWPVLRETLTELGLGERRDSCGRPLPSLSKEQEAEVAVLAFLPTTSVATLACCSRRSFLSAGCLVDRRREWGIHLGTARQLREQNLVDDQHWNDTTECEYQDWLRLSELLREGGWTDDD